MEKCQANKSKMGLIVLIYIAFISLGLPDGLLGVAWPGMRDSFGLPLDALGILILAFTGGYLTSSFFNGVLIKKMGIAGLLYIKYDWNADCRSWPGWSINSRIGRYIG